MSIEVIVPWRGGCPHRARALEWVLARYGERHGDWTLTVSEAPAGAWCKAAAVMPTIAAAAEVVVVADADVWCDGLSEAVEAVQAGAAWAVPHQEVHRLDPAGTATVLAGGAWARQPLSEAPYTGLAGGGILVAHRQLLEAIPLDPRFRGWGQEDECWAYALDALLGPPWRAVAPLVHLWHPPQPRLSRRRGSGEGWQLRRRYLHARSDPNAMRRLLAEATCALNPAQPALHDHATPGLRD